MSARDLITTREAAAYLGLSPSPLASLRCRGGRPVCLKVRHWVLYERSELDSFLFASRRMLTRQAKRRGGAVSNRPRIVDSFATQVRDCEYDGAFARRGQERHI